MRFDKDTRKQIHDARGGEVTIRWPAGAPQPEKGAVHRIQPAEEAEKIEGRMEYSPPTHRDVMARMHLARHGTWPEGYKPPKPKLKRPTKDDDCILVTAVFVASRGWDATVMLYEEADPIRHTGLKTKVPAGLNPIDGFPEPTELEMEQIVTRPSRRQREEEDDALKLEHEVSVDLAKLAEAERKLAAQRKKGKSGKLAEAAVQKMRRRAELASADVAA